MSYMTASNRTSGSGGPQTAAITNDDEYTYTEPDNGYEDMVNTQKAVVKDSRSF